MTRNPDRPKILYVDDQIGNLTVFRASLRRFADIHTVSSGAEALARLAEEEFPIVISDQRMAGLSGTELLGEVRRLYPDTIRILLTAYADFNAIVSAINEGRIARFVRKPWNREEMCAILDDANQLYQKNKENRLLNKKIADRVALADYGEGALGMLEALKEEAQRMVELSPVRAHRLVELVRRLETMAEVMSLEAAAK